MLKTTEGKNQPQSLEVYAMDLVGKDTDEVVWTCTVNGRMRKGICVV